MTRSARGLSFIAFAALSLVIAIGCSSSTTGSMVTSFADGGAGDAHAKDAGKDTSTAPARDSGVVTTDAAPACPIPTCDLVGGAEANMALGTHVVNPTTTTTRMNGVTSLDCEYAASGTDAAPDDISIHYEAPYDLTEFDQLRGGVSGATSIPGLGTSAYFWEAGDAGGALGSLSVLVGCVAFQIQAHASQNQLVDLADEMVPELEASM